VSQKNPQSPYKITAGFYSQTRRLQLWSDRPQATNNSRGHTCAESLLLFTPHRVAAWSRSLESQPGVAA